MEILEAYDLTGSFRDAAELAGCSHHTVAGHVTARDAGRVAGVAAVRPQLIDEYLAKVEEWVEQSVGKVPVDTLRHAVPSYPTMSEVWLRLLEDYGQ